MRSTEEIGVLSFTGGLKVTPKTKEAYSVYASIYLDYVDDNTSHFFWRNHDVYPIEELLESGEADDISIRNAYTDTAISIAKCTLEAGVSLDDIIRDYPYLAGYTDRIKTA